MSKSRGYAYDFVQEVMAADPANLGVKFGQECIKHRVSVAEAAKMCGVSRTAAYWWFLGRFQPAAEHRNTIEELLRTTFGIAPQSKNPEEGAVTKK